MSLIAVYGSKIIPLKSNTTLLTLGCQMHNDIQIFESDEIATQGLKFSRYDSGIRLTYSCDGLENYVSTVVIPSMYEGIKVTYINSIAFANFFPDYTINIVIIPDSIEAIGTSAFQQCAGLVSVFIGKNVVDIEKGAFDGCISLENISFNGTVAKWNEIHKGILWNNNVPATKVVCSDGEVSL